MKTLALIILLIMSIFFMVIPGKLMAVDVPSISTWVTSNPSPASPGYIVMPFFISGQRTASVTSAVIFQMPYPCTLVNITASARASGGTNPTLAIDLKKNGVSVIPAMLSVTANTITGAPFHTSKITDEAVMTIDLVIGGDTPTWDDISVILVVKRL